MELQTGIVPAGPHGNFPLFVYFLRALQTTFGYPLEEVFVPYLFQSFFILLVGAFTYRLGVWVFTRHVGILACFGALFYGRILDYNFAYANAIPIMFFLTGAIYFLVAYRQKNQIRYLWIGSLFLGISAWGRTTTLMLIGVFVLWLILLKTPLKKMAIGGAIVAGVSLIIATQPAIQDYLRYNQLVLVAGNGPMNLFIGNNPESQGQFYGPPEAISRIRRGESTYQQNVIDFITHQPFDWLQLMLKKMVIFLTFPWWRVGYLSHPSLTWVVFWMAALGICVTYLVRLFTPFRAILYLSFVGYALFTIIFFVEERFRIPILPVMFILFAAVLVQLWHDVTMKLRLSKHIRLAVLSGGIMGIFVIFMTYPQQKTGQAIGEIHTPPIHSGLTIGQSFVSPCNRLYQIDIKIRTNNPEISQKATFYLKEGGTDGQEIYSQVLDTKNVRRANYTSFSFPEIPDSAGKPYTFLFDTSAMQAKDNGLVVLVEPEIPVDTVESGSAIFDGQNMPGDITFFAYCRSFLNW
jgi:hypothetical protein